MKPTTMTRIIGGKRYSTESATLIAHDAFWDGHNWERQGRNRFLFRTPKGNYFIQHRSSREREFDRLEPVSRDQALALWDELSAHEIEFEDAFPGVEIEDA